MEDFDTPIFKKAYELYGVFYQYRTLIPKQDRYAIWQQSEKTLLEILEGLLTASHLHKQEKLPVLKRVSLKLNLLSVFIRLTKEIRAIDNKKYVVLEEAIDEIGRMLGGWMRSLY